MKKKLCLLLLGISTMLGCTHTARLYPVQGPLSAQTPLPVLFAKITGAFNPGDISVVLSDGEMCKGRWVLVHPVQAPKGGTTANVTTNVMSPVWDTVYGPGFYVSHVLGARTGGPLKPGFGLSGDFPGRSLASCLGDYNDSRKPDTATS